VFLKRFYDVCEGNDDVKRLRTPMCGARRGSGTVAQMWLTEAKVIATLAKVIDSSWAGHTFKLKVHTKIGF
jgi:hypothetical protein